METNLDINDLFNKIMNNPLVANSLERDSIYKQLKEAEKTLSPQVLKLYLMLLDDHCTEITMKELLSMNQQYDYLSMLGRIVDTLSKFTKEQQEYILVKSIDAAAQVCGESLLNTLSNLVAWKKNTIGGILEVLRTCEPFIVQSCREVIQGIITQKHIEDYLKRNKQMVIDSLAQSEQLLQEVEKAKE